MAYYPQNATGLNYITYPAGPTVGSATVVTAHASINTKGSYAEITASTCFTCNAVWIDCYGGSSTAGVEYQLDLATGAGGAEVIKIQNMTLALATVTDATEKDSRFFPLAIAASTRVAARVAATTGGVNLRCGLSIAAAGGVAGIATFVGAGPSSVDPGGSANTKGSYTQLFSSTSAVIQWLHVGGVSALSTVGSAWYVDVATGAGGSEVVLISDLHHAVGPTGGAVRPTWHHVLTYIAASTRIAARASCDNTTVGSRPIDVTLIGGTAPSESGSGGAFAAAYVG